MIPYNLVRYRIDPESFNMAAPMRHMERTIEKVCFPVKSGASLVKTNQCFLMIIRCVIKVFSTSSGELVRELYGHKSYVTGVAIHPRNKLQLVSSSQDSTVIVWEYEDGVLLRQIPASGSLQALYTLEGHPFIFLLLQSSQSDQVCDLISLSLSKGCDNASKILLQGCSKKCRKTALGPKASFCVTVKGTDMKIIDKAKQQHFKHKIEKDQKFTCVVVHPNKQCIATGCSDGKIYLWYKFLQKGDVFRSVLHWHALPVRDMCYTQDGSFLLSGGHECVLVKWHPETRYKNFLPRLGAAIQHLVCSQDNMLYATLHDDNVIKVINSNFEIQQVFQGLTRGYLNNRKTDPFPAGLLCDPRSHALVLNGSPGHIQFYSVQEDRQLYNLDIVGQNYISPENVNKELTVTEVTKAEFDSIGHWLATVEFWNDMVNSPEIRLKFWEFDEEKQSYVLNTTVEMPHEKAVCSLVMRPISSISAAGTEHMAVTSSQDGKFKIWTLVDDTDIYRANEKWSCESVGFYRDLPAGNLAFSQDGSLLAVLFGPYITLWDPENNQLKKIIPCSITMADCRHVQFGNHSCCQYLVTTTNSSLTVWDLLTVSVMWSVDIDSACLTKDPRTDLMAVFTRNNDLFVFHPDNPSPVFSHTEVSKSAVLSATFVPHSKKSVYENTSLSWQAQSELYFMNADQELLAVCFEVDSRSAKTKNDVVNFSHNIQQSALSLIMSHHSNKSGSLVKLENVAQQPDGKYLREILSSSSQVQPLVSTLCGPFIQSLLKCSREYSKPASDSDEEDTQEVEMASETESQD